VIACGRCWFCEKDLFSLCENGNTNPAITEMMWGQHPAGIFGYSHAMGGFKGSHAEFIRVPYADTVAFSVPEALDDQTALFASDSAPTGWMGADMGNVQPGDVVAVWGCGAVGQMAARAAILLGAERVVVIDRFDYRLRMAEQHVGAETFNYEETNVDAELREMTGGRARTCASRPSASRRTAQDRSTSTIASSSRPTSRRTGRTRCGRPSTPAARAELSSPWASSSG
jgi:threonine dehydrogenase-like Zn-dependent dehydrogenase